MSMPVNDSLVVAVLVALALAPAGRCQNQVLHLNGLDSRMKVAKDASLEPTQAITVEAWIRGLGSSTHGRIVRKEEGKGYDVSWSFQKQSLSGLFVCSGEKVVYDPSPNSTYVGEWHHVAWTAELGGLEHLYLDSILVATAPGPPCMLHSGDLEIGSHGTSEEFIGDVDEVRIWNVARTPDQVAAAWKLVLDDAPGLVSVWHFDGDGHDSHGGNDGNLLGGASFVEDATVPFGVSVDPPHAHWLGGSSVQLKGGFGLLSGPVEVDFGDAPSPSVTILGDGIIEAVVPPGSEPGAAVLVQVVSPLLTTWAGKPFRYSPYVAADESVAPGGRLGVSLTIDPPCRLTLLAGATVMASTAVPPWAWVLQCTPELRVFSAWAPFQDEVSFGMPVPEDGFGTGGLLVLQGLVSSVGGSPGSFTNAAVVEVVPGP